MQHRLANDSFAFVSGVTLRLPGALVREVRVGVSRVAQPLTWDRPTYRQQVNGDTVTLQFDRPDNWAHLGFDFVADLPPDAPAGPVLPPPLGRLHTVAETPLHDVRQRLRSQRIHFLGTARNCAAALPASIAKLQELGALFGQSQIHVYENDSSDDTHTVLQQMARDRLLRLDSEQGIAQRMPLRTERLAYARNRLLDHVLAQADCDYVCWADLDGLVGARFTVDGFLSNFQLDSVWDAVFPLTWPIYYDLWALREPVLCASDYVWDGAHRFNAMLGDGHKIHAATQQLAPGRVRGWLPVESAFGGFGLYKASTARLGRYVGVESGEEVCEHVPYHQALVRAGARLYLNPRCITHIA